VNGSDWGRHRTVNVGIAATIVGHCQLKIDLLDTHTHVVPDPETKRNDGALVVAVVYRF
jgi:hypothetical protein